MADTISRRYAKAFLEVAQDASKIDAMGAELTEFSEVASGDDGVLLKALSNPGFAVAERADTLAAVVRKMGLSTATSNLLRLLLENGRFGSLPGVVEAYQVLADDALGRARVSVTSAEPLTAAMQSKVKAAMAKTTGKEVELDLHVEPALIGGLVVKVGCKVYDTSIRNRLEQIRTNLIRSQHATEA